MSRTESDNSSIFLVRLPHIRKPLRHRHALAFNPGLPDSVLSGYKAHDYPFSETDALRIFHDFANLSLAELETFRSSALCANIGREIGQRDELSALAAFAGAEKKDTAWDLTRKLAQKVLLWLLAMEDKLAEIAELEKKCAACEAMLPAHFGEGFAELAQEAQSAEIDEINFVSGQDKNNFTKNYKAAEMAQVGISAENAAENDMAADIATDISPNMPWRVCAANAAIFLPPSVPILAEGKMLEDLAEILQFEPLTVEQPACGLPAKFFTEYEYALSLAKAPLWQALGHSRALSAGQVELENVYNLPRFWLGIF